MENGSCVIQQVTQNSNYTLMLIKKKKKRKKKKKEKKGGLPIAPWQKNYNLV
jgi:hypothetical protein